MYQISNEKFGLFVTELRKEKNLTQKDLAEKLYVSDKTVSKWERGLSMPNVVLVWISWINFMRRNIRIWRQGYTVCMMRLKAWRTV